MAVNQLVSILGIVGAGLGLGGLVFSQINPGRPATIMLLESLALLCLTVYFAGNWKRLKTFSGSRSTRLGLNNILAIVLMAGILTIINFLTIQHDGWWDFSETQHFSLAPQTLHILGHLDQDVRITVFSHEGTAGFQAYRDLLESYTHATPRISVTYVDPEKEPAKAREYEISTMNTAVFEGGGQPIHVTKPTEAQLTSALIRMTKEHFKRLVFLEGHGERHITDRERGGFSTARAKLEAQGYRVARGSLQHDSNLLRDTDVLILSGPRESLADDELRRITHFVDKGGRLLVLLDPRTTTGLDEWVAQWGVTLGPGIVVDPEDRIAQGSPTALLVRRFTDHKITREFTTPLLLPVLQPVSFDPASAANFAFTSLAHSSERSWAETNIDLNTAPEYEEGRDAKGPFALAGALTRNADSSASTGTPSLVVIGNSAFASNAYIMFPGNTDFFLNVIAWLADEDTLIAASPKESSFAPFIPNPAQEHMLFAVQVFSVPFLLLVLGITVWRRRRRL